MEVNYTNGFVVLPREEYDRMKRDIDKLHNVVKLSKAYDDGSINVEYNNRLLYALAVEQFNSHTEWKDRYVLKDSISVWSNELAMAIKEDEEQEQAEEEQADD